jgi:redox-sensitive bicupin YhaK (pirin superfamily)
MAVRNVSLVSPSRPTREGAGVYLRRAFGFGQEILFDPFLMLDDFRNDDPYRYRAGFPWHPHRGIETITYVIEGEVDHGDSLGNEGTIGPGDVQWMTAGSGIIHQEMPRGDSRGRMGGFQLWANLPAKQKMIDPQYRGLTAPDIPVAHLSGATISVISGTVDGTSGPVGDIVIDPEYFDVTLEPGVTWSHRTERGHTAFAYLFAGAARFGEGEEIPAETGTIVLLDDGDQVSATSGSAGARFLFVSGRPLREPIAWGGPIVMNTSEELDTAWRELEAGSFVKYRPSPRD